MNTEDADTDKCTDTIGPALPPPFPPFSFLTQKERPWLNRKSSNDNNKCYKQKNITTGIPFAPCDQVGEGADNSKLWELRKMT